MQFDRRTLVPRLVEPVACYFWCRILPVTWCLVALLLTKSRHIGFAAGTPTNSEPIPVPNTPWDGYGEDPSLGEVSNFDWSDEFKTFWQLCSEQGQDRRFNIALSSQGKGRYCFLITSRNGHCGDFVDQILIFAGGVPNLPSSSSGGEQFYSLGIEVAATLTKPATDPLTLDWYYDNRYNNLVFYFYDNPINIGDTPSQFCIQLSGKSSKLETLCSSSPSDVCQFFLQDSWAECCSRVRVPLNSTAKPPALTTEDVPGTPTPSYPTPPSHAKSGAKAPTYSASR